MASVYDSLGLNGMLGQQRWYGLQQQALNVWPLVTTTGGSVVNAYIGPVDTGAVKQPPDTALAWLDRRVEEMRVRL